MHTPTRSERKEATRQAILDAALRLSVDTGLAGLSLRSVAKEVGIVPTAFYRHFASIEELGLALVTQAFASLRQVLRDIRQEMNIERVIDDSVSILLRNVTERALVVCGDDHEITLDHLPIRSMARASAGGSGRVVPATGDERQRIVAALEQCAGNQSYAAKLLGMSRTTLVKRLIEFDLPRPRQRRPM